MSLSDFGSTSSVRPDKPLVVKCTFDHRMKRITFTSSRNCSYDLLRARVEQCFALSATPFTIRYKDDDGEITDVTSEGDLTEAIHYFHGGDDLPASSASSVFSGSSRSSSRKVTLRLTIIVDYDLSLSDTASLASVEEDNLNASDDILSQTLLNGYEDEDDHELEEDQVTVSSHDTGSHIPSLRLDSVRRLSPVHSDGSPPATFTANTRSGNDYHTKSRNDISALGSDDETAPQSSIMEGADPNVYERLKRLSMSDGEDYDEVKRLSRSERGVQWLHEQNVNAIQSMIGALPEPSVTDGSEAASIFELKPQDGLGGDLALEQDQRGKYYYTYTSSSGASYIQDDQVTDLPDGNSVVDSLLTQEEASHQGEPSPHGLAWIASQRAAQASSSKPLPPNPFMDPDLDQLRIDPSIPPEVLKFIPEHRLPLLPPKEVTTCSACQIVLDAFRYVCTTCGEKEPISSNESTPAGGKGKGKDYFGSTTNEEEHYGKITYPPVPHNQHFLPSISPSPSSSSYTLLGPSQIPLRTSSLPDPHKAYLSPPEPSIPSRQKQLIPQSSQDTLYVPPAAERHKHPLPNIHSPESAGGYELCSSCIESVGVAHASEAVRVISPLSRSPSSHHSQSSSEESFQTLSQLRRTAPRTKGQMRHAFREKVWGRNGWKDVEQDALSECSICKFSIETHRYKCVSCTKFDLCRACYSQVHEIHPSHAFLSVPDQSFSTQGDMNDDNPRQSLDMSGEPSMKHPGVKCHHCMQDIVGARFHCAVCESVDICSNCESAGLPGNLTSPDGGHDSSHIMIKIPYPLESTEVESASRRAISLWHGRDRPGLLGRRRSSSQDSAHGGTVVGHRAVNGSHSHSHSRQGSLHNDDHQILCHHCGQNIIGVRYQCATCRSSPISYNLCEICERKSYLVHDPKHIFMKLPRPVDFLIQTPFSVLPHTLYSCPAGFIPSRGGGPWDPPQGYLQLLYHRTAVCDRCVEHIRGIWLHCAYCGSDLCEDCENLGAHDRTHVFFVFKSMIDMNRLREIRDIENPAHSPPLIQHAVYQG